MAENPKVIAPKNYFTCWVCGDVVTRKRTEPIPAKCPSCKTEGSMRSDEGNVLVEKS